MVVVSSHLPYGTPKAMNSRPNRDGTTPAISWEVGLHGSVCCSSINEVQACAPSFLP
jgi:hypothetical protein